MKKKSTAIITAATTVLVVLMLIVTAPVHAVTLSMALPSGATVGSEVQFDLKTDIAAGESIPVESVTLQLNGPAGAQTCVFEPDGTPISGCEGLSITLSDESNYTQANRWGKGWDGSADINTSFGYGYGFGSTQSSAELTWTVKWDTSSAQAGTYGVDFYLSSSNSQVSRLYRLQSTDNIVLGANGDNAKVEICHKESSKPRTITVSQNAVQSHLTHGDSVGACPASGNPRPRK